MNTNTNALHLPRAGGHRVCPWWVAYLFDNPLRRMIHPAEKILGPYVSEGMTVLDFGCGFGHFALGMARLAGPSGRVVAADIQQKMLDKTLARARKAGLDRIIHPLLCSGRGIGPVPLLDFALASNAIHETPVPAAIMAELFSRLRPGGRLLLMEPNAHLRAADFETEVALAGAAGFVETGRPAVSREMCALLEKPVAGERP